MDNRNILISQFIDDELSNGEKTDFVKEVHNNDAFYNEAISMLDMENKLNFASIPQVPDIAPKKKHSYVMAASFTALAASLAVMIKVFLFAPQPAEQVKLYQRFVLHAPQASNVSLAGSFSDWQKMSMRKAEGGYWEITVPLDRGEYTYSYIIDGKQQIPDPSVPARVTDDFGGENSVLEVGTSI